MERGRQLPRPRLKSLLKLSNLVDLCICDCFQTDQPKGSAKVVPMLVKPLAVTSRLGNLFAGFWLQKSLCLPIFPDFLVPRRLPSCFCHKTCSDFWSVLRLEVVGRPFLRRLWVPWIDALMPFYMADVPELKKDAC